VRGLLVLEGLLQGRNPDFVLLFSSIASVLGGLGYMPYAAGNPFMDAFARQKQLAGDARWISVNWDAWRFGPAPDPAAARHGLAALSMSEQEGIEVLQRVLASDRNQIVVSTADLNTRIAQGAARLDKETKVQGHLELHPRPSISTTWAGPRQDVDRVVAGIWESLLGVERIGIHDNFFELGGHSLLIAQVVSRLREALRIELPLRKVFESPTIAELADAVIEAHGKPGRAEKIAKALILVQSMTSDEVASALEKKNAAVTSE
jgi:acyl carrier protein